MKLHPLPPTPALRHRLSLGFTLMELMVVIVIIGILAGITIPASKGILEKANKMAGENDALQLKNSIGSYFTEYRKYPVKDPGADAEVLSDETLMDILLAADSEGEKGGMNPRRIPFYSGSKAKPAGNGKYRKGVYANENGGGSLWDPWSENYRVVMDTDYNNRVPAPSFVQDVKTIPQGVIVWSLGKDNDENEAKDNVMTW
jgi:prepilin-type N-terminal cleavage/methylation domain-containing protein